MRHNYFLLTFPNKIDKFGCQRDEIVAIFGEEETRKKNKYHSRDQTIVAAIFKGATL